MINLTAKSLRVWVSDSNGDRPEGYSGTGPIEITDLVVGLKLEDEPLDLNSGSKETTDELDEGKVDVDGTLTIAGTPPIGSTFTHADLEVRGNKLWSVGNRIDVEIALSDGSFVPHPRGALRILKLPNPPRRVRTTTEIEVGCDLTWLNRNDAPESNSDITLNPSGDNPTTVINLLAARVGLPELVDSISSPLLRRIPPRQSRSRVDQIAGIALPLLRWVWVDGDRNLRAFPLDLDSPPDFTLNTTLNAAVWDTEIGAIPPPEDVKIRGTKRIRVIHAGDEADGTETTDNTEVTTSVSDPFGNSVVTNTVVKAKGELYPNQYPGDATPITAAVTTTTNTFTGNVLTRRVEASSGLKGVVLPEAFPGDLTTVSVAQRTTTDWYLGGDGLVTKMQVKREELIGTYDSVASPQDALVVTVKEITTWKPYPAKSGWLETKTTTDLREKNPASVSINLVDSPPTPETKPQEEEDVEVPDEGAAGFAGALPKRVLYLRLTFPLYDTDQANNLAALVGKLRWAAALPASWEMPIPDAMMTGYKPFYIFDWTDVDGAVYRYLSHAHSFEFSSTKSSVSMQGLCLGKVVGGVLEPVWSLV